MNRNDHYSARQAELEADERTEARIARVDAAWRAHWCSMSTELKANIAGNGLQEFARLLFCAGYMAGASGVVEELNRGMQKAG